MAALQTELGLYTYERYLESFEFWAQNGLNSNPNSPESLVEFTKLNWARSKRLHKTIELSPVLKHALENINHTYSWIVITEAWCGDSAQNLPVIAAIAKLNPEKIKLYVVLRDENPELMNNYLTKGARAIPKLIAIDEHSGKEVFTWGPRPAPAQQMLYDWKNAHGNISWNEFEKNLHSWYAKDNTKAIQGEFERILKSLE